MKERGKHAGSVPFARTGSGTGLPRGKRAPRVGISSNVFMAFTPFARSTSEGIENVQRARERESERARELGIRNNAHSSEGSTTLSESERGRHTLGSTRRPAGLRQQVCLPPSVCLPLSLSRSQNMLFTRGCWMSQSKIEMLLQAGLCAVSCIPL